MNKSPEIQRAAQPPDVPRHIAIIMDGNGRWAAGRGLPRTEGHRQGVEAVRRTIQAAMDLGISHLTLFSFSSENWSRPESEIRDLMTLLKRFIRTNLADLHKHGVKLRVIGESTGVEGEIVKLIDDAVALTSGNTRLTLTVAFNYGSRNEIARAAARLAERVAAGELAAADIDADRLAGELDTAGLPDPDLLIRTSGEMRLSNFLLWQCAYSEFVFMDCYWPDFGREALEEALSIYRARERRFGGLAAESSA
ncbi:MAG: isoprenyl transferase [Pseudomonadota bacterium]|nr:isoprenyl transferase [Pseudomonadota bacterium]